MSFNRQNWDQCTYKFNVNQSVDAATYGIQTPRPNCFTCSPNDPSINHSQTGFYVKDKSIDVDSELKTLNKPASRCPVDKYLPSNNNKNPIKSNQNVQIKTCDALSTETTRISNPPCTLRSTGWNRWEWLCQNPQDNSFVPFDFNISSRTIVKDNHRPCIEKPLNQTNALPDLNTSDEMYWGWYPCDQTPKQ